MKLFRFAVSLVFCLQSVLFCNAYDIALERFYEGRYQESIEALLDYQPNTELEKNKREILQTLALNKQFKAKQNFQVSPKLNSISELYYIEFENETLKGDSISAYKALKKVKSRTVHQFLTKRTDLFLAQLYFREGNFNKAKEYANRLIIQGNEEYLVSQSLKILIEIAIIERQPSKAQSLYGELLTRYPQQDPQLEIWKKINKSFRKILLFEDSFFDARQHLTYLQSLLRQQYYAKALTQAEYMLNNYPNFNKKDEVLFVYAMTNFHMYRYDKAIPLFKNVLSTSKRKDLYVNSALYLGLSLEEKKLYKEAINYYQEVIRSSFRNKYLTTRAYYLLCKAYRSQNLHKEYDKAMSQFRKRYESSLFFQQLLWEDHLANTLLINSEKNLQIALNSILENSFATQLIVNQYKAMVSYYPKHDQTWVDIYRTFVLKHESAELIKAYTISNPETRNEKVSFLKSVGLRDILSQSLSYRVEVEAPNDFDAWLQKAKILNETGQLYDQIDFLTRLKNQLKQSRQSFPGYLVPYLYPYDFISQLKKEGMRYELDPFLLLALIRESSQFSADSSIDGKYGLLRLDPKVIKEYAFRLGHHWSGPVQLLDTEKNIAYGAFYFSELYNLFNRNIYLALLAFYRSPQMAKSLMINNELESIEDVLELQDRKSSDFIQQVLDTYVMYRVLYHGKI